MAKTEKEYVRLPGRGWRREGGGMVASARSICSLWLGKDHLLCVDASGYTEHYKRLYYADIQALVFHKTKSGAIVNLVFAVLSAIFLALAVAVDDSTGHWILGFFTGMFGVVLLVNFALGPTCKAYVQTAVQTQELPSLQRLRTARRALLRLKPVIEAAQGNYAPLVLEVPAGGLGETPAAGAEVSVRAVATPPPIGTAGRHYHGNFHQVLFILLLVDAVNGVLNLCWPQRAFEAINGVLTAAELICLLGALIRQKDSDLPKSLRGLVWGYLCTFCVMFFVATIYGIYVTTQAKMSLSPHDNPVMMMLISVSSVIGFGFGTAGLVLLKNFRRAHMPPPAPPVLPPGAVPPTSS